MSDTVDQELALNFRKSWQMRQVRKVSELHQRTAVGVHSGRLHLSVVASTLRLPSLRTAISNWRALAHRCATRI